LKHNRHEIFKTRITQLTSLKIEVNIVRNKFAIHLTDVITRLKDYQTKRWEHVERIVGKQIPKTIFTHNPAGKRDPGRPQNRQQYHISLI
jgi:hypothetical protein